MTDTPVPSVLSQPAKLAEAFKYFVQGMGYSKYGGAQQAGGRGQAGARECGALHQVRERTRGQLGRLQPPAGRAGRG